MAAIERQETSGIWGGEDFNAEGLCPSGAHFIEDDTYVNRPSKTQPVNMRCLLCIKDRNQAYREAKRAA